MKINYDGKVFKSVVTSDNGEVNDETTFYYHQDGNIVWAEYEGGFIKKGMLIASVDSNDNLDMRYQHINQNGEIMTGKCFSQPKILDDGRIRLIEKWEWTSGNYSKGKSHIEEIRV
ncbi:n-acetylglutamate synthase [Vallitalea pronyensis]|uniref:N-acetylglutamate synthase n=1 Tax=Vallitalea pronyensis TaxID=1348613 RepID=A0A8J8MFF7_9FIRM|nr:n-acetylglutamate synthase [Vallitalea pronyensis]QUI20792.1 n-acetylglutamate synthase [Vallitalea pronyensis]